MSDEEMLLEALLSIRDTPVEDRPNSGLCGMVRDYVYDKLGGDPADCYDDAVVDAADDIVDGLLHDMFTEWPEFSGDYIFPVPGGYYAYFGQKRWSGEYGAARERLLQWLIERLEHDRENNENSA